MPNLRRKAKAKATPTALTPDALAAMTASEIAAGLGGLGLPAELCQKFEDHNFTGLTAAHMAGPEKWTERFDELGDVRDGIAR